MAWIILAVTLAYGFGMLLGWLTGYARGQNDLWDLWYLDQQGFEDWCRRRQGYKDGD